MDGEIIKDLSSPYTRNEVYLFDSKKHGPIIKKVIAKPSHFKRAIEAFKTIDRSLHPAILKIDMKQRILYLSYNPIQTAPENIDQCAADLMKRLHTSTKRFSAPNDPGTGEAYPFWKDYLKKYGAEWLETLKDVKDYSERFHERITSLKNSAKTPTTYIHRDIRYEKIGEHKGSYMLFGFEHAVWGDPYWDVARYVVESAQSKDEFYALYGVEDEVRANIYVWMFALALAADFVSNRRTDDERFEKYLALLDR